MTLDSRFRHCWKVTTTQNGPWTFRLDVYIYGYLTIDEPFILNFVSSAGWALDVAASR